MRKKLAQQKEGHAKGIENFTCTDNTMHEYSPGNMLLLSRQVAELSGAYCVQAVTIVQLP